jgi:hypothetical protein
VLALEQFDAPSEVGDHLAPRFCEGERFLSRCVDVGLPHDDEIREE